MKSSEIQIRDPFILPLKSEGKYYLYGTTDANCWGGAAIGFNAYASSDLVNWDGPYAVFRKPEGFWADLNYWAPEVYKYKGKYYMFASFKAEGVCRGTQILMANSPLGPFEPHSDGPVTPRDWECLDGTFYVDDNGTPWIIFCHEWVQIYDGTVCALQLSEDLSCSIGKPIKLFKASDAEWSNAFQTINDNKCYVTDGPFIYKNESGDILIIWSTMGKEGYTIGFAKSESGISGPWIQAQQPLYKKDGGHGMVFRDFNGNLKFTIHTPNMTPNERPVFFDIVEKDGILVVK